MKFRYENEADIPAALKAHYKKQADGSWTLECDGCVDVTRLDEFRNNNRTLHSENETLKTKFKDVDPDEYKKLKSRAELVEDGKVIAAEKVEAKITERTSAMKTEHDKVVGELNAKLAAAENEIATYVIDGSLRDEVIKLGVKETAIADVLLRGRQVFSRKDGKLVAKKPDGTDWFSAKNGEALSTKEWATLLVTEAPHLFGESAGSGAGGSGKGTGGGAGSGGTNPWKKETKNITRQMQLERDNPAEAKRLKSEAGVAT